MTSPYDVLTRITSNRRAAEPAGERCEMCSEAIADEHQHVVDVAGRQLMCVCRACYLLFTDSNAELRYRAVPDRYLAFGDFALDRRAWEALQIPVGVAFFFTNSALGRTVAFYPGPAGACESELDLDAWNAISGADSRVGLLADDVEALLVRVPESEDAGPQSYLVPIDACYEFVGRLRMLWRGFDGGQEAREFIDSFFAQIAARASGDAAMTGQHMDVNFAVLDVAPEPYAVSPVLTARVGVAASGDDPVHAIALRCQVRIEPLRRSYSDDEAAGLIDLFGPRERWATTQRTFLWQHCTAMVPGFAGNTTVALPLDCTYDFEVAAAKYLHALRDGALPLQFLFSGTIFVKSERGFSVQQVPWDCEYRYDMPVAVWRELIAQHYPNTGWVRLSHETIAALAAYKSAQGLLDLDHAVTSLLDADRETAR